MLILVDVSILFREKVLEYCIIIKNSFLKVLGVCFRKVKNKKKFFIYFLNGGKICYVLYKDFFSVFIYY